jgi:hypothetical protein
MQSNVTTSYERTEYDDMGYDDDRHQPSVRALIRSCCCDVPKRIRYLAYIPHTEHFRAYCDFENCAVTDRAFIFANELASWSPKRFDNLPDCPLADLVHRMRSALFFPFCNKTITIEVVIEELSQWFREMCRSAYTDQAVAAFNNDIAHLVGNYDVVQWARTTTQAPEQLLMQLLLVRGMHHADTAICVIAVLLAHRFSVTLTATLMYMCNAIHYISVGDVDKSWSSQTMATAIDAIFTGDLKHIRAYYVLDADNEE